MNACNYLMPLPADTFLKSHILGFRGARFLRSATTVQLQLGTTVASIAN